MDSTSHSTNASTVKDTTSLNSPQGGPNASRPTSSRNKRQKGGRKRRNRRQSFALSHGNRASNSTSSNRPNLLDTSRQAGSRSSLYRLDNRSNTSVDSDVLLDHREQSSLLPRRQSLQQAQQTSWQSQPHRGSSARRINKDASFLKAVRNEQDRPSVEEHHNYNTNDRTPLLSTRESDDTIKNYSKLYGLSSPTSEKRHKHISQLCFSPSRSSRRRHSPVGYTVPSNQAEPYDVNNPPSIPSSPKIGPGSGLNDVMLMGEEAYLELSDDIGENENNGSIDDNDDVDHGSNDTLLNRAMSESQNHQAGQQIEADVCFPTDSSEAQKDTHTHQGKPHHKQRLTEAKDWPDILALEDWSQEEKTQLAMDSMRAKRISEPVLVEGRLRPQKSVWHREVEDDPYRWTYFNEELESTIHSQTISGLKQSGLSFEELFIPDPSDLLEEDINKMDSRSPHLLGSKTEKRGRADVKSYSDGNLKEKVVDCIEDDRMTYSIKRAATNEGGLNMNKCNARPTFWLDVLSPTEPEMRVLQKTFGIHGLTIEDIMLQEAREKVELFRNYYFVSYRSFEQDSSSEHYMEPVNIYVVVFREGVLSFHYSMTPHPANVRRRMRQLRDYLVLNSDWISYGIIDDITDAYAPLIERVEDEVDVIDGSILGMHSSQNSSDPSQNVGDGMMKSLGIGKRSEESQISDDEGNMLRRVGECRRKVMGLYRLLGNKADVIKGFAKRCNEQWEVAPRSEIGFYLGDIQDHIVTMTANLSHYENLLSRAHSNYLAQLNIRMNERQEKTADVLGKLTVLGTIVLPMNIVTGMWGMNVLVPGQNSDNLSWFWSITAGLILFGSVSYFIAKRVYGIV